MKRYTVYEYPCKGPFSSSLRIYHMLKKSFKNKGKKITGGIIVFPQERMNIDTSFIEGNCREKYLISGVYTAKDGTKFSGTSICLEVDSYSDGDLMSLALKYSRLTGQTILLKDFEDRRLYSIHFNGDTVPITDRPVLNTNGNGRMYGALSAV